MSADLGFVPCCSWVSNGRQCRNPGAFTTSTRGGGDGMCSAHARCSDMNVGAQIVEQSFSDYGEQPAHTVENARAKYLAQRVGKSAQELAADVLLMKRFPKGLPAHTIWAHRIIARKDSGCDVPQIAFDHALDVVNSRGEYAITE